MLMETDLCEEGIFWSNIKKIFLNGPWVRFIYFKNKN